LLEQYVIIHIVVKLWNYWNTSTFHFHVLKVMIFSYPFWRVL
jgi:hypothetical protein